jgi:hypothetical protein
MSISLSISLVALNWEGLNLSYIFMIVLAVFVLSFFGNALMLSQGLPPYNYDEDSK